MNLILTRKIQGIAQVFAQRRPCELRKFTLMPNGWFLVNLFLWFHHSMPPETGEKRKREMLDL